METCSTVPRHAFLEILLKFGRFYQASDDLNQAAKLFNKSYALCEKLLDHLSKLDAVNNLGNLYNNLGRLEEAERMFEQTLARKKKALGPDHRMPARTDRRGHAVPSRQAGIARLGYTVAPAPGCARHIYG